MTGDRFMARALTIDFSDDESTGIKTVNREPLTVNQTFNLQGQRQRVGERSSGMRVGEGHKGLVIKNGKKIFLK